MVSFFRYDYFFSKVHTSPIMLCFNKITFHCMCPQNRQRYCVMMCQSYLSTHSNKALRYVCRSLLNSPLLQKQDFDRLVNQLCGSFNTFKKKSGMKVRLCVDSFFFGAKTIHILMTANKSGKRQLWDLGSNEMLVSRFFLFPKLQRGDRIG